MALLPTEDEASRTQEEDMAEEARPSPVGPQPPEKCLFLFCLFFACDQLIGSPSVRLAAGNLKNEKEDTGDHFLQKKRLRPLRQVVAMDNRCFNSHIDNTKIMFLSAKKPN